MAVTIAQLIARVSADISSFEKAMDKVEVRLKNAGDSIAAAGTKLTSRVTAPIVAAGGAILVAAGNFEAGMNRVLALTGATEQEFAQLEKQAKELGATTQFSASQAADAMGFLAQAGFEVNEIYSSMPATLNLAASAGLDLATSADIVSNIMTGFGIAATDTEKAVDVLTKTMTSTNTNLVQLGEAMAYAAPIARGAGQDFNETAAAIGILGNAGIQGSRAGTVLRAALTRLLDPSKDVRKALEELSITTKDSGGNLLPLVDIIEQLGERGATTGQIIEIFGKIAGTGIQALVDQGAPAIRELTEELDNAGGTAERVAAVQMQGLNGAMKGLRSALEAVAISIAEAGLIEWATTMANRFADLVRELSRANPELLKWGTVLAGALAALGPILVVMGKLLTSLGTVVRVVTLVVGAMNPWVAAIAAAAAAGVALYNNWDKVVAFFRRNLGPAITWLTGLWDRFGGDLTSMWDTILNTVSNVVNEIILTLQYWAGVIEDVFLAIWDGVTWIWANFGDDLLRILGIAWDNIVVIFRGALNLVSSIMGAAMALIRGDWDEAWEQLKQGVGAVWNTIVIIVGRGVEAVLGYLSEWLDFIPGFSDAVDGLRENISTMIDERALKQSGEVLDEELEGAQEAWGDTAESAVEAVAEISGSLLDGVPKIVSSLGEVTESLEEVQETSEEVADPASGAGAQMEGLVVKIGEVSEGIGEIPQELDKAGTEVSGNTSLTDAFTSQFDVITEGAKGIGGAFAALFSPGGTDPNNAYNVVLSGVDGIMDLFSGSGGLGDRLQGFIKGNFAAIFAATGPWGAALAIATTVLIEWGDEIIGAFRSIFGVVKDIVNAVGDFFKGIFGGGGGGSGGTSSTTIEQELTGLIDQFIESMGGSDNLRPEYIFSGVQAFTDELNKLRFQFGLTEQEVLEILQGLLGLGGPNYQGPILGRAGELGMEQTIVFNVDGYDLATLVVPNMPEVIELNGVTTG